MEPHAVPLTQEDLKEIQEPLVPDPRLVREHTKTSTWSLVIFIHTYMYINYKLYVYIYKFGRN